ncbi:ABC transporter permease subunit [Pseudooceanicola sp. C21-150M6]|uniref:ABC transporter permease subunit n=1 Tax=Pseudooceanicola sp. C21-150M6 TaxID=3434355 RepID=UPI003D7F780D
MLPDRQRPATWPHALCTGRPYSGVATGSDRGAAFVAGDPINRIRFGAYMFCGLMSAIAGLIVTARIGSGDPQSGTDITLLPVTAVVVGGRKTFSFRLNLALICNPAVHCRLGSEPTPVVPGRDRP